MEFVSMAEERRFNFNKIQELRDLTAKWVKNHVVEVKLEFELPSLDWIAYAPF